MISLRILGYWETFPTFDDVVDRLDGVTQISQSVIVTIEPSTLPG